MGQVITRRWHPSPRDAPAHAGHGASSYLGALFLLVVFFFIIIFIFFIYYMLGLWRGSAVGVFGASQVLVCRLEVGSAATSPCCHHVPVLSHSLACLFLVFIYLPPRCQPRAGWLCRTPLVVSWLLPALSKSCCGGSVPTLSQGGERLGSCESNATTISHQTCARLQVTSVVAQGKLLLPSPWSPWLPALSLSQLWGVEGG